MFLRTPIFKSPLDGRWAIRPYGNSQAPIFLSPGPAWNRTIARMNIVATWFVPGWLQRRLDVRPGAKAYWAKVRREEQRQRDRRAKETSND